MATASISALPPETQCGPSASWPVVLVPIEGPWKIRPVSIVTLPPLDVDAEAVHAARRGSGLLLTGPVVLAAVARALEPLRARALGNPAAEVRALLVEGVDAGLHADEHGRGVDGLGLRQGLGRVRGHPGPSLGHVVEAAALRDPGVDVVERARGDLAAEAALRRAPQEADDGGAEAGQAGRGQRHEAAVEELAPGDPDGLGIGRDVRGRKLGRRPSPARTGAARPPQPARPPGRSGPAAPRPPPVRGRTGRAGGSRGTARPRRGESRGAGR